MRYHVGNLLVVHLADLAASCTDQMVVVAAAGFDRLILRSAVERVAADDAGLEENLHGVVDRGLGDVERAFGLEARMEVLDREVRGLGHDPLEQCEALGRAAQFALLKEHSQTFARLLESRFVNDNLVHGSVRGQR